MGEQVYLLVGLDGRALAAADTADEIADVARRAGLDPEWLTGREPEAALRVANPRNDPVEALRACGLRPVSLAEVLATDPYRVSASGKRVAAPSATYERIKPYFQAGRDATAWSFPRGEKAPRGQLALTGHTYPGSGFLSFNAKLAKKATAEAVSLGLALAPEQTIFRGASASGNVFPHFPVAPPPPGVKRPTLCYRASTECAASCLVNTGQNAVDVSNDHAKLAKTAALLADPAAFLRVLLHALARYARADRIGGGDEEVPVVGPDGEPVYYDTGERRFKKKKAVFPVDERTHRFVRLNVLSDVPWELVAPWLFDGSLRELDPALGRLAFYDYTKVTRRFAPNYDLTHSYSGANWDDCSAAWEGHGGLPRRKVAAVFVAPQYKKAEKAWAADVLRKFPRLSGKAFDRHKERLYRLANPLPTTFRSPSFLGGRLVDVVDGDKSDLRPLDPWPGGQPVLVGLRWKPPKRYRVARASTRRYLPTIYEERGLVPYAEIPTHFVLRGERVETDRGWTYVVGTGSQCSSPGEANLARAASFAALVE